MSASRALVRARTFSGTPPGPTPPPRRPGVYSTTTRFDCRPPRTARIVSDRCQGPNRAFSKIDPGRSTTFADFKVSRRGSSHRGRAQGCSGVRGVQELGASDFVCAREDGADRGPPTASWAFALSTLARPRDQTGPAKTLFDREDIPWSYLRGAGRFVRVSRNGPMKSTLFGRISNVDSGVVGGRWALRTIEGHWGGEREVSGVSSSCGNSVH